VWVVAFRAWMAESGVEPWSRRKLIANHSGLETREAEF
jgi:hypothetical protein